MQLREIGELRHLWITVYECPSGLPFHEFLWVADTRWVFPLLELGTGVKERLLAAEPSLVELAVSRIRMIDHKTVSIVGFEHTLLGCYREPEDAASGP